MNESLRSSKERHYSLLVLLAAMLWGTTGTAQSFAPAGTSPLSLGSVRLAIGGAALLLYSLLRGSEIKKELWLRPAVLLSALAMAAYQLFFFAGVLKTGVAAGTMVTIGSSPIFAGGLAFFFSGERPKLRWILATLISILGCILLIGGGSQIHLNGLGIVLNLSAGFSYALYAALSKDLLAHHSPEAVTGTIFSVGALLLSPFLFFYDLTWLRDLSGLGAALHLGLLATALAYILFSHGLAHISFPKAVTLTLGEPLTAAALGIFLLREELSALSGLGMLLVFSGLLILTVGPAKESPDPL